MKAPGGADRMPKSSPLLRWTRRLVLLALLAFGGLLLWGYGRNHPEDVPWTSLDLSRPIGTFTGRKLAETHGQACRTLLAAAGIRFTALPPHREDEECRYEDAVRLVPGGATSIAYRPDGLATSCPVAAAL